MSEFIVIYLLSIAESISGVFWMMGWMSICLFAVLHTFYGISYSVEFDGARPKDHQDVTDKYVGIRSEINKHFKTVLVCSVVFWTLSALFPSTKSVLTAYALVEGSKVINADNAEMAAEAVGKRFDKFLDIVDRGINGREPEPQAPK